MPASLWAFVDERAAVEGEPNGGRLIERWITEKAAEIREAA